MNSESTPCVVCLKCSAQVADGLLACPGCGFLIHSAKLKELSQIATEGEKTGDIHRALKTSREMLDYLPANTSQYAAITITVDRLSRQIDSSDDASVSQSNQDEHLDASDRKWFAQKKGLLGILAVLGVFVLSKGKLLLAGLTKSSTLLTMLASLGVYWTAFGWKFAIGLVVSIYIHEMGHVAALTRYGISAKAPMFIPGIGAVVRLKQRIPDVRQDAIVGLAGPVWGMGAAICSYGIFLISGWPAFAAIGRVGAWINLLNLMPIGPLDGGRAFKALNNASRWLCCAILFGLYFQTDDGLLLLIGIVAVMRAFETPKGVNNDKSVMWCYILLAVVLSLLSIAPIYMPELTPLT
jgi:Zn-dependent protease